MKGAPKLSVLQLIDSAIAVDAMKIKRKKKKKTSFQFASAIS